MNREPALVGAVIAAATAIVAVLVAFNVPMTEQQQDAILGAIGPVLLLVLGLATRQFVTPKAKVVEQEKDGLVVAGEASELPTGTVVREAGSLNDLAS